MSRVVEIPPSLDDRSFDQLARAIGAPSGEPFLFDARAAKFASPYGLAGMLSFGQWLAEHRYPRPRFALPSDKEVAHYWARIGFFRYADEFFELHGHVPRTVSGSTDVLLDLTPVRKSGDVHAVVGRVQERSAIILSEHGLEAEATLGFAMALSEACQNIVEHAGTGGWVAVQVYSWRKRLNRKVILIGVSDAGVGFRESLAPSHASDFGDRWGDATALEAAVFQGLSRFSDEGRGQGLAGMRRYVDRWKGKLSLRSGTARLTITPPWDDDPPLAGNLPAFPGSQLLIIIPAATLS